MKIFSRTKRLPVAFAAVAVSGLLVAGVAIADNIQNDVVASGVPASKTVTITAGGAGATVNYNVAATSNDTTDTTGRNGQNCNAVSGAATITPSGMPAGVSTNPPSVTFNDCSTSQGITFAAGANTTPGSYPISVSVSDPNNPPSDYNTSPGSFTLVVQAPAATLAAPTVAGALSGGTLGNADWYKAAPTATWTLGGGAATSFGGHCLFENAFRASAPVPSIDTAAGSVTCSATNTAGTGSDTLTYKLDSTNPSISVTGVTDGATYYVGTTIPTAGCSQASDATSGVASSSTSPTLAGGPLGAITATCSATDFAGNVGGDQVGYSVLYERDGGILQPINADGNSVFSQKRAVPVKFQLKNDAPSGFSVDGWQVKRESQQCGTEEWNAEALSDVATTSASTGLRYDAAADQYIANATLTGTTLDKCYRFVVQLNDGTAIASPKFKVGR